MKKIWTLMAGVALLSSAAFGAALNKDVTIENTPPSVVKTTPQCGEIAVDPTISEISVVFSKDMQNGCMWSICAIDQKSFPKLGVNIRFLEDKRTCVIPVTLERGKTYALWFNHGSFNNFMDEQGNPSIPYLLIFKTKTGR